MLKGGFAILVRMIRLLPSSLGIFGGLLGHIWKSDAFSGSEADTLNVRISWVKKASGENNLRRNIFDSYLRGLFYSI